MSTNILESPQVYITVAKSVDRTETDSRVFFTKADSQSMVVIPPEPTPMDEPCEGFTGSTLEQCEITQGMLLSCTGPEYVKIDRAFFDVIASTPAVIVQTEPGKPTINDFTTHICLSQQTIDLFNSLGGAACSDPNFIFDDQQKKCVCGFNGSTDLEAECGPQVEGALSAKTLMLYEIAYNGASDVGSIRDVEGADLVFDLLSLAAETGAKNEFFQLARLQVNPVIDWNDVA